jgi:ribosomal protein S18 acetylase RimI-like enzyme
VSKAQYMQILTIDSTNVDREHICCAIGNDRENTRRAQTKKDWLKDRFAEGLVFKRLDARGKIFIEYMPIERVWKPLIGHNFMVINCLWVSGQFKGQGYSKQLLQECLLDARTAGMDGVAVVTSTKVKPFLTDKKFYTKHGFKTVDTAPPYFELLALPFDLDAPAPRFADHVKNGSTHADKKGFTFVFSNQCPFMEDYGGRIYAEMAQKRGIETHIIPLKNYGEAQRLGSPFGTFGLWFNGNFQFHDLMTEAKFEQYLDGIK